MGPARRTIVALALLCPATAIAQGLAATTPRGREVRDVTIRVSAQASLERSGEFEVEGESRRTLTIVSPGIYTFTSPRIELSGTDGARVDEVVLSVGEHVVFREEYGVLPGELHDGWSRRENLLVKELGEPHVYADGVKERVLYAPSFRCEKGQKVEVVARISGRVPVSVWEASGPIVPGKISAVIHARFTLGDQPVTGRGGGGGGGLPGPSGAGPIELPRPAPSRDAPGAQGATAVAVASSRRPEWLQLAVPAGLGVAALGLVTFSLLRTRLARRGSQKEPELPAHLRVLQEQMVTRRTQRLKAEKTELSAVLAGQPRSGGGEPSTWTATAHHKRPGGASQAFQSEFDAAIAGLADAGEGESPMRSETKSPAAPLEALTRLGAAEVEFLEQLGRELEQPLGDAAFADWNRRFAARERELAAQFPKELRLHLMGMALSRRSGLDVDPAALARWKELLGQLRAQVAATPPEGRAARIHRLRTEIADLEARLAAKRAELARLEGEGQDEAGLGLSDEAPVEPVEAKPAAGGDEPRFVDALLTDVTALYGGGARPVAPAAPAEQPEHTTDVAGLYRERREEPEHTTDVGALYAGRATSEPEHTTDVQALYAGRATSEPEHTTDVQALYGKPRGEEPEGTTDVRSLYGGSSEEAPEERTLKVEQRAPAAPAGAEPTADVQSLFAAPARPADDPTTDVQALYGARPPRSPAPLEDLQETLNVKPGARRQEQRPAADSDEGQPLFPADELRLESRLGRGATASVWSCWDLRADRPVAVKLANRGMDAEAYERFAREASLLTRVRSPHVVQVYDHRVTSDGRPYLVMELVSGKSLQDLLRTGKVTFLDAVRIGGQVAKALAAAHAQGVVHRDVKPQNVLLDQEGNAKLTDFGLGKDVQDEEAANLTRSGVFMGTFAYTAPEQISHSNRPSHQSDVFALGSTIFYMLHGKPPLTGDDLQESIEGSQDMRVLAQAIYDRRAKVSDLKVCPQRLRELLQRMLDADPEKRPAAHEVADELERMRTGK